MTTLLYIAPFEHSWGSETHLADDAEAIGCEVVRIREADVTMTQLVNATRPRGDADLVLYTCGRGIGWAGPNTFREFEAYGTPTASYSWDLFRGLERESEVGTTLPWRVGTAFTPDCDPTTTEWMRERGVNHVGIPPACVSSEAIEVSAEEFEIADHPAEVVFLGSTRAYHPEYTFRLELIAGLRQRYGSRFAAFGPQEGTIVRGLEMNALFQSNNRVVVGDSLQLPGRCCYTSDRIMESLGRGAALVYPHIPGFTGEHGFEDKTHARFYDSGDLPYVLDLIDGLLENPDEARAMALRGQQQVRDHHLYTHRVATILRTLDIELPALPEQKEV